MREMFLRPRMRKELVVVRRVVLKVMRGGMGRKKRRKMKARKTRLFRWLLSQRKRRRGHQQRLK